MGLATLDSKEEGQYFFVLFEHYASLFDIWTHIGGVAAIPKTLTEWYWTENGTKLNFTLKFLPGAPDNVGGNEVCLTLTISAGSYFFNDLKCYENYIMKFVCQTVNYVPAPEVTTPASTTPSSLLIESLILIY